MPELRAVAFRNSFEFRRGNHGEFRDVLRKFCQFGPHKELLYEKRVPGIFANDLDGQPVVAVCSGIQIHHIEIALRHVLRRRARAAPQIYPDGMAG